MKNKKRYKYNNRGKMIAMLIFSFILMLSVGYTALNEELTISGEAKVKVESDIRITGINLVETTFNAIEDYSPNYGKDTVKVGVTLPSNNSTVKYRVKITNYGNNTMKLTSIAKTITNNNYNISFNKTLPLKISKLSEEEIEITFSNNTSVSQTLEVSLKFTFEKLESMMTVGNGSGGAATFYRGSIAKNTVESITFMSTKEVPNNAIGYWDVSYTAGANEAIAYYLDEDGNSLYELYIAADGEVYAPSDSSNLFLGFTNMTSINFNNSFNTSKATLMGGNSNSYGMFNKCSSLLELDVTDFNTENVTTMQYMFAACSKLTSLNLTSFDTKNVTTTNGMFSNDVLLESITFGSSFTAEKVTDMRAMFYSCKKVTQLDLSMFNTKELMYVGGNNQGMFASCFALSSLNISNFNTSKVTNLSYIFADCNALSTILFGSNFNTTNVTNMKRMFFKCGNLQSLDLSTFNTQNVQDMSEMFFWCQKLITLNLSSFETNSLTTVSSMFNGCGKLNNLDIRNMDFEGKTISTTNIFQNVPSGVNIYVKNAFNESFIQGLKSNANVIIYVPPEPEPEES